MDHQRHIIREAVVAVLAAAGTTASTRVYDTPYDERTTFPALVVESDSEDQQANESLNLQATWRNRLVQRTLQMVVSAEVQQTANYARARDQLLAQVEAALATTPIAGVKSIAPTGFKADLSYSGDKPIAVGRQRFDFVYTTAQATPGTST